MYSRNQVTTIRTEEPDEEHAEIVTEERKMEKAIEKLSKRKANIK